MKNKTFTKTRYEVQYQPTDKTDKWFCSTRHETLEEAETEMAKQIRPSKNYMNLGGGLTVSFPKDKKHWNYRILKIVSECEVLKTAVK